MARRGLPLAALTLNELNIVLGLLDDLTQNLSNTGKMSFSSISSGALTVKDSDLTITDDVDVSKRFQFQASSISNGTKRTVTIPDADTKLPIATQTLTFAGPTAARTITLPDADGSATLLGNSSTGSGVVVLQTSPSLVTPNIGESTATSIGVGTSAAPTASSILVDVAKSLPGPAVLFIRANNPNSTGRASVIVRCGDATTSARFAFAEFYSSETTTQDWILGMNGSKSFVIRDNTAGSDRCTIDQATGGMTLAYAATLTEQTAPSTPASGKGTVWVDSTASILCFTDDSGVVHASSKNAAIASQGAGFSSDTYVTNSDILIPSFSMQAKTTFTWRISASKTAAGVATPVYNIRIGTNKSTADTARLTLTAPAQTAVADIGTLNIMVTVRSVGASGVIQGTAWWDHRGTAANTTTSGTGFANDTTGHVQGTSAGFGNTALGGSSIGLSINGGASAAWTLTQVIAEANW